MDRLSSASVGRVAPAGSEDDAAAQGLEINKVVQFARCRFEFRVICFAELQHDATIRIVVNARTRRFVTLVERVAAADGKLSRQTLKMVVRGSVGRTSISRLRTERRPQPVVPETLPERNRRSCASM